MSHAEQTDLRARRTHRFLQEAMIELVAQKGFEAITVGDIAERAMINRATFYRHYQDKYDLVAKIFEDAANQFMEDMKPLRKDIDPGKIEEYHLELWSRLFEHVAKHDRLYKAMLGRNGSPWFAARMREHIVRLLLDREQQWEQWEQVKPQPRRQTEPAVPPELPALQFAQVVIGTIVWWLESEQRYTPRQMAAWSWRFALYGYLSAYGYAALALQKE